MHSNIYQQNYGTRGGSFPFLDDISFGIHTLQLLPQPSLMSRANTAVTGYGGVGPKTGQLGPA